MNQPIDKLTADRLNRLIQAFTAVMTTFSDFGSVKTAQPRNGEPVVDIDVSDSDDQHFIVHVDLDATDTIEVMAT